MAICPSCGATDRRLVKSWSMIGKPSKSGDVFKLTMGLYKCDDCGESFRSVLGKEKASMKELLEGRDHLEMKLLEATQKRAELEKMIQALEDERASLFTEIEALRLIPKLEERASSLESEVKGLREEKESLLTQISKLIVEKTPPAEDTQDEAPMASVDAPAIQEPVVVPASLSSEDTLIAAAEPVIAESGLEEPAAVDTLLEPVELDAQIEQPIVEQIEPSANEAEGSKMEVEQVPVVVTVTEPEPVLVKEPQATPAQIEPALCDAISTLKDQALGEKKPESVEVLVNASEQVPEVIEEVVEAPVQVIENAPEEVIREASVETTEMPLPVPESPINEMAAVSEVAIAEPAVNEAVEEAQLEEDKAILEEQAPQIIDNLVTKGPAMEVVEETKIDEAPVAPSGSAVSDEVENSIEAEAKPSSTTTSESSEKPLDAPLVTLDPIIEPTTVTPPSYDVTSSDPHLVNGEPDQAPTESGTEKEKFSTETKEAENIVPSDPKPTNSPEETDPSGKMD